MMEHAKKMVLIDPRMIQTQQEYKVPNPQLNSLGTLDNEMKNILDSNYPEDEKIKLYEQSLQKYLTMYRKYISPRQEQLPPTESGEKQKGITDEDIVESVPKSMRDRAAYLVKMMKKSGLIQWNERGELLYKGEVQEGTNIADLVNDVLRRRRNFSPEGSSVFVQALKEAHVPETVIGHKERWHGGDRPSPETWKTPSDKQKTPESTPKTSIPRRIPQFKWETP